MSGAAGHGKEHHECVGDALASERKVALNSCQMQVKVCLIRCFCSCGCSRGCEGGEGWEGDEGCGDPTEGAHAHSSARRGD